MIGPLICVVLALADSSMIAYDEISRPLAEYLAARQEQPCPVLTGDKAQRAFRALLDQTCGQTAGYREQLWLLDCPLAVQVDSVFTGRIVCEPAPEDQTPGERTYWIACEAEPESLRVRLLGGQVVTLRRSKP